MPRIKSLCEKEQSKKIDINTLKSFISACETYGEESVISALSTCEEDNLASVGEIIKQVVSKYYKLSMAIIYDPSNSASVVPTRMIVDLLLKAGYKRTRLHPIIKRSQSTVYNHIQYMNNLTPDKIKQDKKYIQDRANIINILSTEHQLVFDQITMQTF